MITIVNTTERPLLDMSTLIIHNFPFFKEVMVEVKPTMIKDVFKEMNATVIVVKDKVVAAKAHIDNPSADIYILAKGTYCVTLAFKGTNGIKEEVEQVQTYSVCPSEMINFN